MASTLLSRGIILLCSNTLVGLLHFYNTLRVMFIFNNHRRSVAHMVRKEDSEFLVRHPCK